MAVSTEPVAASETSERGRRQWLSGWRGVALVLALAAVTFLLRLGAEPLTSPNEGLYAEAAREMLEGHDFVVPRVNSVVYFEKPPLLYWLDAASMGIFGENAMAARLPSALAGIASVLAVLAMGGVLAQKRRWRILPAVVLATSVGFVIMARQVMFDALLCATMTAALVLFWLATERKSKGLVYAMYAALALGVLAKGLMGIVLPGLVVLAYCATARDWARLKPVASAGGIALFLAMAVPWHVAVAMRYPQFTWFYFVNEHVLRFLGTRQPRDFPRLNATSPTVGLLYLAMPWSTLFPAMGYYFVSRWRSGLRLRRELKFVLCWALVPLVFFTISKSRMFYYMLPAVPPFALMVGYFWGELAKGTDRRLRRWVVGTLLAAFVVVFVAWMWSATQITGNDRSSDRAALAFASCIFLVAGVGAALIVAAGRRPAAALACLAGGTALALAVASVAVTRWPAGDSLSQMAALTGRMAGESDPVVALDNRLEMNSSFVFYLPERLRPVLVVNGRTGGDLQFGSKFDGAGRLFISYADLARIAVRRHVVYLTDAPPRKAPPAGFRPVMKYRKDILWANFAE